MKFVKATFPISLIIVMLISCSGLMPVAQTNPTETLEVQSVIHTSTPVLVPSPTKTFAPIPQSFPTLMPSVPTTIVMDNGLTWTECVLPKQDYAYSTDMEFVTDCLKKDRPYPDDNDKKISGERIEGELNDNLRLVIGQDIYETRFSRAGDGADYELLKNGQIIAETSAAWTTFDPNRNLWNIGEKAVWEVANPSVIIVDGVNQNEKHKFDKTYFPYAINSKLIYIAKKNGKYNIVYDEKVIGPEFDWIYLGYCCGNTIVVYGQSQYWFWGKREGKSLVVDIH